MEKERTKLDMGGGKEEENFELNLELSIGGRYGKPDNSKGKFSKSCEDNVDTQNNSNGHSRSNFCSSAGNNVSDSVDLQRRREIQALRRQEASRKREEKIKKSRGQNGTGFVGHILFLEAQKLQARVQEREIRERDCLSEEKARKKGKNCCSNEVADDLSLSLFTENKISSQQKERDCLYPKVQQLQSGFQYPCGIFPSLGPNAGEEQKKKENVFCRNSGVYSSMGCDSEQSNGINDIGNEKTVSNRSLEQSSSAVYRSMPHEWGSSSDTGSHWSPLRPRQHFGISRNALDQVGSHDSSSQTEIDQGVGGTQLTRWGNPQSTWRTSTERSKPDSSRDQTTNTSSTSEELSKETSGGLTDTPVQASNYNLDAASVRHMPCVSATGNGPSGKTITGFLYKYTKTEVSIMCVCHGRSFSPAEFVEHAGGVGISQPLKHITVVPSAFG